MNYHKHSPDICKSTSCRTARRCRIAWTWCPAAAATSPAAGPVRWVLPPIHPGAPHELQVDIHNPITSARFVILFDPQTRTVIARVRLAGGERRRRLEPAAGQAAACGRYGRTGLGLPPVVQHWHAERSLRPAQRFHVAVLAGCVDRAQRVDVVFSAELAVRIGAPDDAERRGHGEQGADAVLLDYAGNTLLILFNLLFVLFQHKIYKYI